MWAFAGATDVGVLRQSNEDNLRINPAEGLCLVADGMGGTQAGDVAAELCTSITEAFVIETRRGTTGPLPYEPDPRVPPEANRLCMGIRVANARVYAQGRRHESQRGMGSTIVALLVDGEVVHIAHIGDSRVYRLRGGKAECLTRDHTKLNALIDQGRLAPDAPYDPRDKKALNIAIGTDPDVFPTLRMERTLPGDLFLLCSDGLTDAVSDRKIAELHAEERNLCDGRPLNLDRLCKALIDRANHKGGDDNITVVLAENR